LHLIAHIGKLLPAAPPDDRGQGRNGNKSSKAALLDLPFGKPTLSNYRKVAKYRSYRVPARCLDTFVRLN